MCLLSKHHIKIDLCCTQCSFLDTVDIPYYWKAIYGTSLVKKCIKPYTPHLAVNGAINARYLSWLV